MIFLAKNTISAPPWHTDPAAPDRVLDSAGRLVADVPQHPRRITCDQSLPINQGRIYTPPTDIDQGEECHRANLAVIVCAPELLSALKSAAYHLDRAGIPLNSAYYDLINRAQPDLPVLTPVYNRANTQVAETAKSALAEACNLSPESSNTRSVNKTIVSAGSIVRSE